ncbi:MAG: 3'-5' exonuclease [Clostridia bacterium]|nr:3'-5' exonuclease [Clostridia bacterium]
MKYLFFDIECAGVFKNVAKICAFGYCLTDEQFHILEREDLLINPKGGFHLTDRKGRQGLVLPYKYEEFKRYPDFTARKEKIYSLLEDKNTLVVGHATMNDVKYLNFESKRFSLPSFKFSFADTQFLYMNRIGVFSRQFGLGTIAADLGVEFTPHRAVDDAYATMKVAEALCRFEGRGLPELIKKYEITLGRIENYEITQASSRASREYAVEAARRKEERENARRIFHVTVDKERRKRNKAGKLAGKSVCFSHAFEVELERSLPLFRLSLANGLYVTGKAEECDYYVAYEGESGPRVNSVKGERFTPEGFEEFLQ